MDSRELESQFRSLGPWVTRFEIDGRHYGGEYDAINDERVAMFHREFPDARRVAEMGPLEGGHTIEIARHPGIENVVGFEGREINIARARFVTDLMDVDNVEFRLANLETHEFNPAESFDTVFCIGLLYHLPRPWILLKKLRAVSPRLFLWTHLARWPAMTSGGYYGESYREQGLGDPQSGMSADSFWVVEASLLRMLADAGFSEPKILLRADGRHGPEITLACR